MAATAQQLKIRRMVWTGAIAAVTATGAWYGAGLKTQQEVKKITQKTTEATTAETIAMLEQHRGSLMAKRIGLERKIAEIEARRNGATREESKVGRERRK